MARELAAVGGEDFGRRLRYVDGRFAIFDFWLGFLCFQWFGDVREIFIYVGDASAEPGDADFEAVDLALHLLDGDLGAKILRATWAWKYWSS